MWKKSSLYVYLLSHFSEKQTQKKKRVRTLFKKQTKKTNKKKNKTVVTEASVASLWRIRLASKKLETKTFVRWSADEAVVETAHVCPHVCQIFQEQKILKTGASLPPKSGSYSNQTLCLVTKMLQLHFWLNHMKLGLTLRWVFMLSPPSIMCKICRN